MCVVPVEEKRKGSMKEFEVRGLPEDTQPIVYLSSYLSKKRGMSAQEEVEILRKQGLVKYRCFSHAFCCKGGVHFNKYIGETLKESIKAGMRVMMDSGAFSFHAAQRKFTRRGTTLEQFRDQVIESYVEFCRKYSNQWDFYVTFDYRIHGPTVYEMTKKLEGLGMRPVPVFHGDDGIQWLERYCEDGHKLICVGGTRVITGRSSYRGVRSYYDEVFNLAEKYGVKLHGLAQTAPSYMFQYPWASLDSATWARYGNRGMLLTLNEKTAQMGQLHVSDRYSDHSPSYNRLTRGAKRQVERQVEEMGFDFQQIRTSGFWRSIYNAKMFTVIMPKLKEIAQRGRVEWESLV